MLKHLLFTSLLCLACAVRIDAQSCGNDEKYHLPYKNTYVKEPLVTENEYRVAKPQVITPKSFAEARQILPNPIWAGHPKEIEMYWCAWEIAVGNIRAPQEGSGFVSSYLDTAYNGNIFMWDSSFILMFARYGARFFPFQQTLDNFYAKQHLGWAGLPPIAELIEFIIGIRGDYVERQIVWDLNLTEENGIERYPFGPAGMIDLKAEARRSPDAEPRITVNSNIPFTLVVLYGDKEKKIAVEPGQKTY